MTRSTAGLAAAGNCENWWRNSACSGSTSCWVSQGHRKFTHVGEATSLKETAHLRYTVTRSVLGLDESVLKHLWEVS